MVQIDNGRISVSGTIILNELILSDRSTTRVVVTESGEISFTDERNKNMKQDRNKLMYFAGFLQASSTEKPSPAAPGDVDWEVLGRDNDDLSKELNPDTEITKNVLGETTMTHSGYEPAVGLDPYYIDPSRLMYRHLQDIAMREVYDEANCMGYFAEAFFETANAATQTMSGYCYVRRAWFVPESVGGDTAGMAIPVAITPVGGMTKKKIVYDMTTNQATISDLD